MISVTWPSAIGLLGIRTCEHLALWYNKIHQNNVLVLILFLT